MASTATTATLNTQPVIKTVNRKTIRLQKGDLTALEVDGVVFYAREDLQLGSGFGTAIGSRGGAAVKKELEKIGQLGMGEAVVTGAGSMKPKHIIHACGPKFHEADTENKLRACMRAALAAAEGAGLKTVAFPPMGAGFYGVPFDLCAKVMLDVISKFFQQPETQAIQEAIICVIDDREFRIFQPKVEAI